MIWRWGLSVPVRQWPAADRDQATWHAARPHLQAPIAAVFDRCTASYLACLLATLQADVRLV